MDIVIDTSALLAVILGALKRAAKDTGIRLLEV